MSGKALEYGDILTELCMKASFKMTSKMEGVPKDISLDKFSKAYSNRDRSMKGPSMT